MPRRRQACRGWRRHPLGNGQPAEVGRPRSADIQCSLSVDADPYGRTVSWRRAENGSFIATGLAADSTDCTQSLLHVGQMSKTEMKRMPVFPSVLLLLSAANFVFAQQVYPSRPIRLVVPFPAGGAVDIMARDLGQRITEAWRQQGVIDDCGGANG